MVSDVKSIGWDLIIANLSFASVRENRSRLTSSYRPSTLATTRLYGGRFNEESDLGLVRTASAIVELGQILREFVMPDKDVIRLGSAYESDYTIGRKTCPQKTLGRRAGALCRCWLARRDPVHRVFHRQHPKPEHPASVLQRHSGILRLL
jgi:hypothetical protein